MCYLPEADIVLLFCRGLHIRACRTVLCNFLTESLNIDLPADVSCFFYHVSFALKKKQEESDPGPTAVINTAFYFYWGQKLGSRH